MSTEPADQALTDDGPLRVGLIADAEGVELLAPAVSQAPLVVAAQSGPRPQPTLLPGAEWHDDERVMLAQSGIQAVLVATSARAAPGLSELAAERRLCVWRLPPVARSFAEAAEFTQRCRKQGWYCRVASWWEAVAEQVRWGLEYDEGVKPGYTEIRVAAVGPSVQSWRASLVDAPGGVLATDGYQMLEALVGARGLPESVSAVVANVRRRPGEVPRETEDVATALFRYEGGRSAAVHATWDVPPFAQSTAHHGPELTVVLRPDGVAVHSRAGELLDEDTLAPDDFLRGELERFVAAVRQPDLASPQGVTLERHMAVTALLQATYLSARTGQPESPLKFYEVQGWPEPQQ
jgi:predicted dehydrogenase